VPIWPNPTNCSPLNLATSSNFINLVLLLVAMPNHRNLGGNLLYALAVPVVYARHSDWELINLAPLLLCNHIRKT